MGHTASTSIVMNLTSRLDRDDLSAKFWLGPVSLARNFGFSASELRQIEKIVIENETILLEAWYGHFGISS